MMCTQVYTVRMAIVEAPRAELSEVEWIIEHPPARVVPFIGADRRNSGLGRAALTVGVSSVAGWLIVGLLLMLAVAAL